MQAEHVIDDGTVLSLYDSLVPKLREHRKFSVFQDTPFTIEDFRSQLKVRELEQELQLNKLPNKIYECEMLKARIN